MKKLLLALAFSTLLIGCGKQDDSVHVTVCDCAHHDHACVCKDGECKCQNCPEHNKVVPPCPACPTK